MTPKCEKLTSAPVPYTPPSMLWAARGIQGLVHVKSKHHPHEQTSDISGRTSASVLHFEIATRHPRMGRGIRSSGFPVLTAFLRLC